MPSLAEIAAIYNPTYNRGVSDNVVGDIQDYQIKDIAAKQNQLKLTQAQQADQDANAIKQAVAKHVNIDPQTGQMSIDHNAVAVELSGIGKKDLAYSYHMNQMADLNKTIASHALSVLNSKSDEEAQSKWDATLSLMKRNGMDTSTMPAVVDRNMAQAYLDQSVGLDDQIKMNLASLKQGGLFGSPHMLKDSKTGKYYLSAMDQQGGGSVKVLGVGHNETPQGDLVPVENQTGLSATEKVAQLGREALSKESNTQAAQVAAAAEKERQKVLGENKGNKEVSQASAAQTLEDVDYVYGYAKNAPFDQIYGKYNPQAKTDWLKTQAGIDAKRNIERISAMLELAAAGQIKGQGSVTGPERELLKNSATNLRNYDISPEMAKQELDAAMKIIYRNAGKTFSAPENKSSPTMSNW